MFGLNLKYSSYSSDIGGFTCYILCLNVKTVFRQLSLMITFLCGQQSQVMRKEQGEARGRGTGFTAPVREENCMSKS